MLDSGDLWSRPLAGSEQCRQGRLHQEWFSSLHFIFLPRPPPELVQRPAQGQRELAGRRNVGGVAHSSPSTAIACTRPALIAFASSA
jgi:hypothetical protein